MSLDSTLSYFRLHEITITQSLKSQNELFVSKRSQEHGYFQSSSIMQLIASRGFTIIWNYETISDLRWFSQRIRDNWDNSCTFVAVLSDACLSLIRSHIFCGFPLIIRHIRLRNYLSETLYYCFPCFGYTELQFSPQFSVYITSITYKVNENYIKNFLCYKGCFRVCVPYLRILPICSIKFEDISSNFLFIL